MKMERFDLLLGALACIGAALDAGSAINAETNTFMWAIRLLAVVGWLSVAISLGRGWYEHE